MKNNTVPHRPAKVVGIWLLFAVLFLTIIPPIAFGQVSTEPGMLDTRFGRHGVVSTQLMHPSYANYVEDVLFQPDGKIVTIGWVDYRSYYQPRFLIARYNQNGTVDEAFGESGASAIQFELSQFGENSRASAGALQSDGKIVAAGVTGSHLALARYTTDGALDTAFGSGGFVRLDLTRFQKRSNEVADKVFVLPDGKILVVGSVNIGNEFALDRYRYKTDILTVRFNPDGSLDETYANAGITRTLTDLTSYTVASAALAADGSLFVTSYGRYLYPPGYPSFPYPPSINESLILKYRHDGTPDDTFGVHGKVTMPQTPAYVIFKILDNGKLLVNCNGAVSRLNSDGSLDAELIAADSVVDGKLFRNRSSIAQTDGKIISYGKVMDNYPGYLASIRTLADGQIDTTFGANGLATISTPFYGDYGIFLQPDGKVLCAGTMNTNPVSIVMTRHFAEDGPTPKLPLANAIDNVSPAVKRLK